MTHQDGAVSWLVAAVGIVGACTGLGAFIDFYIGKGGQKKVRDRMITYWDKFDDIKLGNFGKEEATYTLGVISSIVGARLFSVRRLWAVVTVWAVFTLYVYVPFALSFHRQRPDLGWYFPGTRGFPSDRFLFHSSMDVIQLSISISITLIILKFMRKAIGTGALRNVSLFFILIFVPIHCSAVYPTSYRHAYQQCIFSCKRGGNAEVGNMALP